MDPHIAYDDYDDVLKESTLASSLPFLRCRVNIEIPCYSLHGLIVGYGSYPMHDLFSLYLRPCKVLS